MAETASGPILELHAVNKRFGGVQALEAISLPVEAGTVFGIIGPNGAGKTTLFNCISGFLRPDSGSRILYRGRDLAGQTVYRIARRGIARTFQNVSLIRDQTARQNILTGLHLALPYTPLAALLPLRGVWSAESTAAAIVEETADLLGIERQTLDTRVDALSLGQQKKIEIARAIARKPQLLLLDEPAGGLNDAETADLAASIRTLRQRVDLTIILIDHDMNLVMDLCDRIAVLDFGRLIAIGSPAEIQADPAVIAVYLGAADAA